ncbi:MAG: hypothetical protein R3A46_05535 [Thermomicrobiales bacterium]
MSMTDADKAIHDRVATYIAETRFPFPDQTDWPEDYQTIVNAGNPRAAGRFRGHLHYPDILVVDGNGNAREVGEVEMDIRPEISPRITMASMTAPLIPETDVRHFFLYVPVHEAERAREFIKNYRISLAGLRTFEIDDQGEIHIEPVETWGHRKDHRST